MILIIKESIYKKLLWLRPYGFYDSIQSAMKKVCAITKKGSIVGGGYSNRTRATKFNPTGKKRKYPNLQKKNQFDFDLVAEVLLNPIVYSDY
jgi:hypothetical protein